MERKKRRKSHRIYALVVIVLGLAIICISFLLLFYVQKIEVTGNEYCKEEEVLSVIKTDQFSFNSLYVLIRHKSSVPSMPKCLEEMNVSMRNPWTIRIKVKEKPIVGFVYEEKDYVYFDKTGLVVLKSNTYIEGVPSIEGIEVGKTKLYEKLNNENEDMFTSILETTEQVKRFELAPDRIAYSESGVELYFGTIRVLLGTDITPEKVAQITPILQKLEGRTGTLHLEKYENENTPISFQIEEPAPENE